VKAKDVLAIVLAGGVGKRLYPLTRDRAKPAVPFGGAYRLIDFTLSNAINSDMKKIFILSQYKSLSLHRHIQFGWNIFNPALNEFITLLPPQQRINEEWYTGTASAVHQNLYSIRKVNPRCVLILSSDHVYKMDYAKMADYHERSGADLTVGAIDISLDEAHRFGVLRTDSEGRILDFLEKPRYLQDNSNWGKVLGSMGIYIFNTDVLMDVLEDSTNQGCGQDFGGDVIPSMLRTHRVMAYPFVDENKKTSTYWRDVGTIDSFWEANMDLVAVDPLFNLYDPNWPIRTYQEQYPPAKTVFAGGNDGRRIGLVLDSIISNGCIISGGRVQHSVLSPGVKVNSYSEVYDSILMDGVQVGRNARIRRAIIDKRVVIPPGTEIGFDLEEDRRRFTVSENQVVVIPKGTILPPVPAVTMQYVQKSTAQSAVPLW
jgi:glucose-1-phosphate adenylyltransferase